VEEACRRVRGSRANERIARAMFFLRSKRLMLRRRLGEERCLWTGGWMGRLVVRGEVSTQG